VLVGFLMKFAIDIVDGYQTEVLLQIKQSYNDINAAKTLHSK
jgi:hypothetical protein